METVDQCLIPGATLERAAGLLRVLTHAHRLRICELLLRERCSVGELARQMGLKHNVVSQHLNHLRVHGIVSPNREGKTVFYEVVHPGPRWLLSCIRMHCEQTPDTE